jgi:tetratricopeptide (TPR) repeat protein
MMPFTGGQSNSLQHLSQNGSAVNMAGNTGRSYSQINRSSPNKINEQQLI